MSTRRKKKTTREKSETTSDGSSTDSEYSKTLKIINKLSQKYLGSTASKRGSSKKTKKTSPEKDYDGDVETTDSSDTFSINSLKSSSSAYDFDEEDPIEMEVSPSAQANKKKNKDKNSKNVKTTSNQKKTETNTKKKSTVKKMNNLSLQTPPERKVQKSSIKKSNGKAGTLTEISDNVKRKVSPKEKKTISFSSTVLDISSEMSSPVVALQRMDISNIESCQRQLRKRKSENSNNNVTPPKVTKPNTKSSDETFSGRKTEKTMKALRKRDSGVCLSPPQLPKKIPLLSSKDTSTPSHESNLVSKTGNYFGFNNLRTFDASLDVSPVNARTPVTPMSDYASMDSMSCSMSFNKSSSRKSVDHDPSFELFSREDDELTVNKSFQKSYKPKTKNTQPKKPSVKKTKADDWAKKVNLEFSDIEQFELNIDG